MLLIGAQISDTLQQIKSEMTMHIQIRVAFMYTCKHAYTHTITRGMFNMNS